MGLEIMRLSAKGQLTIPASIRKKMSIKEGDYLQINIEEDEIRIKKVQPAQPLSAEDPIWKLVGAGESGLPDVSVQHDQYLVHEEIEQWKNQ